MGLAVVPSGVSVGQEPGLGATDSRHVVLLAEFPSRTRMRTRTTRHGKAPESQCGAQTVPPAPST